MNNTYLDAFKCPSAGQANPEAMARHMAAVTNPQPGFEQALVELYYGWLRYADEHKRFHHRGVGEDAAIGLPWVKVGWGLRTLLNGETGRFHYEVLDSIIAETMRTEGFDPDEF